MSETSKTDWERLLKMNDSDIDTSDIPPLDEDFFHRAELINMHNPPIPGCSLLRLIWSRTASAVVSWQKNSM